MPRALVAAALPAGGPPPPTSPPLVAKAPRSSSSSSSSSVSTLDRSPGPDNDADTSAMGPLRSSIDALVAGDRDGPLPRTSSVGSVGRGVNTLMARRPSIFTDENDAGAEARRNSSASDHGKRASPPLSRMSLSSVGGLSSINAPDPSALPTPSPARQRPGLSALVQSERGHRTMLSSGSVRSFGGRSQVAGQHSPSPPPRSSSSPSLAHQSPSLQTADAAPDHSSDSARSTSLASRLPPGPGPGPVNQLLKSILSPAVVRYPHAPGHESPRAFEEGCSKPPSPRPANHYRHHREAGDFALSDDVQDALVDALSPVASFAPLAEELTPTPSSSTHPLEQPPPDESPKSRFPPIDTRMNRLASLYTRNSYSFPQHASSSQANSSRSSYANLTDSSLSGSQPSSPIHRPYGLPKSHSFVHQDSASLRSIASAIRERRMQASSMSNASFTDLMALESVNNSMSTSITDQRRTRSRGGTRMGGISDLAQNMDFRDFGRVQDTPTAAARSPKHTRPGSMVSDGSSRDTLARVLQHNLDVGSFREVIMTPTTEEWRYLGGVPGKMRKFHDEPDEYEEEEDEDAEELDEVEVEEETNGALGLDLGENQPQRGDHTAGIESQHTPTQEPPCFFPDVKSGLALATMAYVPVQGILELDMDAKSVPILNAMSTQSIMSEGTDMTSSSVDMSPRSSRNRTLGQTLTACSLSHDGVVQGPIDPRSYSAYTLARDINSFVIEGEAGNGAYGFVKRAREKGENGMPVGKPLIIKYIVKQKILADCWKKHKVLGPIPIEIHVLDHLRRVAYRPSVIASTARSHRRPPSRRASTFGLPTSPLSPTLSIKSLPDPLAYMSPRTSHPNICGILDYFEDVDYYYLVMPCFGDGQDLFDYVDLAPDGLPIHEVRSVFGQVADAAAFLHEHNIVHRDIKDENVIMDGFGNVQLIDFGSAAYIKEGKIFDTFSGTLDFAAPEVLRGERHSGKEIDVWALGVLFYVLLCGECPFWNANECATGVILGSRARIALESKCNIIRSSMGSMEKATGSRDEVNPEDALDLISKCLALEAKFRPSAFEVCQHRFLVGNGGWSGAVI